jgi:hypothetical protein
VPPAAKKTAELHASGGKLLKKFDQNFSNALRARAEKVKKGKSPRRKCSDRPPRLSLNAQCAFQYTTSHVDALPQSAT